jgi:hypothetical protein
MIPTPYFPEDHLLAVFAPLLMPLLLPLVLGLLRELRRARSGGYTSVATTVVQETSVSNDPSIDPFNSDEPND